MKLNSPKADLYATLLLLITSVLTVLDLFLVPGRSANMDGIVHTVTPNLFYLAIRQGEFPVSWIDGFANYGLPLGIIAHQLTTYLTSLFQFIFGSPVTSFNVLAFLGFFLSSLLFYFFLRIYFLPIFAFAGAIFFHFAPYRILNIYIRGAIPEFFAGVFVPLLLISMYLIFVRKKIWGLFLLSISIALIALTHPFMLIISAFIALPYLVYLLFENHFVAKENLFTKKILRKLGLLLTFSLIGIGLASFYILPLILEIKYFYYGQTQNHLTPGNYLGLSNFLDPNWYYFTKLNILPRGFVVNLGLIETFTIITGVIFLAYLLLKEKFQKSFLLFFAVITSIIVIFFTTKYSDVFYQNISFLGDIQFPWRLLATFIFLPPIIVAFVLQKLNKKIIVLIFIAIICIIRFPQLYGKNYVLYPESDYSFTALNLHAVVMNPVWTAESTGYPIKSFKPEIIEGEGELRVVDVKNNLRLYVIDADTPVRMVDYTFYFPGWNVYTNGQKTQIEYQDPNYRGVITYRLPEGRNEVEIRFEDTKVRFAGKLISLVSLAFITLLFLMRKKIPIK